MLNITLCYLLLPQFTETRSNPIPRKQQQKRIPGDTKLNSYPQYNPTVLQSYFTHPALDPNANSAYKYSPSQVKSNKAPTKPQIAPRMVMSQHPVFPDTSLSAKGLPFSNELRPSPYPRVSSTKSPGRSDL